MHHLFTMLLNKIRLQNNVRLIVAFFVLSIFFVAGNAVTIAQTPGATGQSGGDTSKKSEADQKKEADEKKAAAEVAAKKVIFKEIFEEYFENLDAPQLSKVRDTFEMFFKAKPEDTRKEFAGLKAKFKALPPAEIIMARLWIVVRQFPNARVEMEQAVKNFPNDPESYLMFAEVANAERRVTDSDALLDRVEKTLASYNEDSFRKLTLQKRYYNQRAAVQESRSEWAEAKKNVDEWIKLESKQNPNVKPGEDKQGAIPYARLGRVLFQLNKNDKTATEDAVNPAMRPAYDAFIKAAQLDKKGQTSANTAMAILYQSVKNQKVAKTFFESAFKEPKNDDAEKDRLFQSQLFAAQWAISNKNFEFAKQVSDSALTLKPDSPEANLLSAIIDRFNKNYASAVKTLDKLINKYPDDYQVSNNLALSLVELEGPDKQRALDLAIINFNNARKAQDQRLTIDAASTLGWIYFRNGKFTDAEGILQQVLAAGLPNGDSAYYVAKVLENRSRWEEIQKILTPTLEQTPVFYNRNNAEDLLKMATQKLAEKVDDKKVTPSPAGGK